MPIILPHCTGIEEIPATDTLGAPDRLVHLHTLNDATVMIVDDEPIMIEVLKAFLEDAGYSRFVTKEDSTEALEMLHTMRPDILLLDLVMPGKTGFELLAEIRAHEDLRFLPVIMLTAANDAQTKLDALELGATDFLAKPVDSSELRLRLRNALAFKAYQDQLAYYDALTALPNRQMFMQRLAWTLKLAKRHGKQCALLQIGIDRFKQINDTLGHEIGDEVLKAVVARLAPILRESDTLSLVEDLEESISLSRLAGDEFVVLMSEIHDAEDASGLARRLLNCMQAPLMIEGHELFVTLSAGIALFPQDAEHSAELLTNVDLAMAQAKLHGRNTYAFCSPETNARSFQRLALETALRKALEKGELELHFQPKVDLATGRIFGAEALMRWKHPDLGNIPPAQFIPLAEETGLILQLGEMALRRACHVAAQWQCAGYDIPVSVNVSSLQFKRGNLPAVILDVLGESDLNPSNLIIELTESLLMDDAPKNLVMMHAIKALGVRLSMDDFGTGYSSLGYLKRFPLDELKIDQIFVRDLPDDPGNTAIVGSVIAMAHGLGLSVTAEGVETDAQMDFLRSRGCDQFQGYLFSRPLPTEEFFSLLTAPHTGELDVRKNMET